MLNCKPDKCKNCWLQIKCVAGCYIDNYFYNRKLDKPADINCEYQFKKVEAIIYFVSLLSWEEKEKLFNKIYLYEKQID